MLITVEILLQIDPIVLMTHRLIRYLYISQLNLIILLKERRTSCHIQKIRLIKQMFKFQ